MKRILQLACLPALFASSIWATDFTLSSFQIKNWHFGGSTLKIRLYSSDTWTDSLGYVRGSGTAGSTTGFYQEIVCSVSGRTATCPSSGSLVIPSTVKSIDRPQIRITGSLFDQNNIYRGNLFQSWVIPTGPTTTTWLELLTYNSTVRRPLGVTYPTIAQGQTMINGITPAPNATTVIKGISTVSVTPVDVANPKFVGDNDPRIVGNIDASDYASLAAAVTAIGSSVRTLVISTTDFPSGSSVTIPSTLTLQFTGVGTLSLGGGHTVTHLGGAEGWPIRKIFSGSGVIKFGGSTHPRNSRIPEVYPQWWGATGDNVTDNLAAFNAARDAAGTLGSGAIKVTQGNFYLSKTLVLTTLVKLIGSSGKGTRGGAGHGISQLVFPAGVTGILVAAPSYSTAQPEGGNSSILDIEIRARAKSGTAYGVHLNMRAAISNIYVNGFSSHGIYIDSNESDKNCNNWYIENVALYLNGGDGLRVNGNNANAGNAIGVDAAQNAGYGIRDTSFLGNTYIGPHSMGNTLGGFSSTGGVNRSTWVLPYAESGQPNSSFNFPALVFGGTLGGGGQDMSGNANYFFNNGEIRAGNPAAVTNFQVSDHPSSGVLWQRTGEAKVRIESLSAFGTRDAKLELYVPNGGGDDPAGTVSFRAQTSGVETEFARISANRGTGGGALTFRIGSIDAAKISGVGLFSSYKGADVASAAKITPTGNVFTITGVITISTISTTGITPGTVLHMITTSAGLLFDEAGNLDITNATSLTSTANGLVIAVWDGTKWRIR